MANNRVLLFLILVCFILVSCKKEMKKQDNDFQSIVIADVTGDGNVDTLVRNDNNGITTISIKSNNYFEKIINLLPLVDSKNLPVETVCDKELNCNIAGLAQENMNFE